MPTSKKISDWLDIATTSGTVLTKAATAFGVTIVVLYCTFVSNFFPTGLAIGDSLLFLFIALGFGFLYLIFLALEFVLAFSISQASRWPSLSVLEKWSSGVAIFVAIVFLIFIGTALDIYAVLGLLLGVGMMYVGLLPWAAGTPVRIRNRFRVVIFTISAIVPLIFGGHLAKQLIQKTIQNAGLADSGVSLIVDKDNLKAIQAAASQMRIPVLGCQIEGSDETIVHNFAVLWHGVGERSLVQLNKGAQSARIEVKRDGLRVVRWTNKVVETCLSLQADSFFDSNSSQPNRLGEARIKKFKEDVKSYTDLSVVGAEVVGHSDSMLIKAKNKTNFMLSEERAIEVTKSLCDLVGNLPPSTVIVEGMGNMHPTTKCDGKKREDLKECLAADRRVTIKLRLTEKSNASSAQYSANGSQIKECPIPAAPENSQKQKA